MSNKTVLITGAAHRLGAAIARDLHGIGMDIVIHYNRSAPAAAALAAELNSTREDSAATIQADLLDEGVYGNIIEQAHGFKNRLDVLINNASAFYPVPVNEVTFEQWDELINTNLKAPFFLAQMAIPYLRGHKGCIINLSDIHGIRPLKNYPVYSTGKAGLNMLTQALARELGPDIRVNGVAPGAILWPEELGKAEQEKILSRTALKRQGNPADIAKAVRYLILDAGYMTGHTLVIDGGRTLFS